MSLTGSMWTIVADGCKQSSGIGGKPCSNYPDYATDYWNTSNGIPLGEETFSDNGYTYNGQYYNLAVCLNAEGVLRFCSLENEIVFVANYITAN